MIDGAVTYTLHELPHLVSPEQEIATIDHQGASFSCGFSQAGRGALVLNEKSPQAEKFLQGSGGGLVYCRLYGVPVFAWFVDREDTTHEEPGSKRFVGNGIAHALYETNNEPFTDAFQDWVWGGPNLLRNGSFEESLEESTELEDGEDATGTAVLAATGWVPAPAGRLASDGFRVVDDIATAYDGTKALRLNPLQPWAGAQQTVAVPAGAIVQASAQHRKNPGPDDDYTLSVRTLEGLTIAKIKQESATTYEQYALSGIQIPDDVFEVIYRFVYSGVDFKSPGNNATPSHLDACVLSVGFPPDSIGQILGVLFDDAQTRGCLPFLTRTWTDTEDSNGVTWDAFDLGFIAAAGSKLGDSFDEAAKMGYPWSVTYNAGTGEWDLNLYTTAAAVDVSGDPGPAILTGRDITVGTTGRRRPTATFVRAYGPDNATAKAENVVAQGVSGRIEKTVRVNNVLGTTGLQKVAQRALDVREGVTPSRYEVIGAESSVPLLDYSYGWRVGTMTKGQKLIRLVTTISVNSPPRGVPEFYIDCDAPVATPGRGATVEGVRRALKKASDLERRLNYGTALPIGPSNVIESAYPFPLIASADASDAAKAATIYVCDGSNDWEVFKQASADWIGIDGTSGHYPTIHLTPGYFNLECPTFGDRIIFHRVRVLGAGNFSAGEATHPVSKLDLGGLGDAFAPILLDQASLEHVDVRGTPDSLTWDYSIQIINRGGLRNCSLNALAGVIVGGEGRSIPSLEAVGVSHGNSFENLIIGRRFVIQDSTGARYHNLHINGGGATAGLWLQPKDFTNIQDNVFSDITYNPSTSTPLVFLDDSLMNATTPGVFADNVFRGLKRTAPTGAGKLAKFDNSQGFIGRTRFDVRSCDNLDGALFEFVGAVPALEAPGGAFASANLPPATNLRDGIDHFDTGTDELCIVKSGAYLRASFA